MFYTFYFRKAFGEQRSRRASVESVKVCCFLIIVHISTTALLNMALSPLCYDFGFDKDLRSIPRFSFISHSF